MYLITAVVTIIVLFFIWLLTKLLYLKKACKVLNIAVDELRDFIKEQDSTITHLTEKSANQKEIGLCFFYKEQDRFIMLPEKGVFYTIKEANEAFNKFDSATLEKGDIFIAPIVTHDINILATVTASDWGPLAVVTTSERQKIKTRRILPYIGKSSLQVVPVKLAYQKKIFANGNWHFISEEEFMKEYYHTGKNVELREVFTDV